MHRGSGRGRTVCCSHQISLAIRCRSHRTAAGLYATFLKLQASCSSAEYRVAGVPPLSSFQHLVLSRIGREQVQMLAAGEVVLMVLLRCMAAELMAVLMEEQVLELMADLLADLMLAQLAWLAVVDLIAELSSIRTASR